MHFLYKIYFFFSSKMIGIARVFKVSFYQSIYKGRITIHSSIYGPIPECLLDSSDSRIKIDRNVSFRGKSFFLAYQNGEIVVGKDVFFNRQCSINSFLNITIGEDCIFGERVSMWDHNHKFMDCENLIRKQGYHSAGISIGRNCWVGANVIILKGVVVGEGVVIAAGSLVNRSIPSFEIWGGVPARKIRNRRV